MSSFDRSPRIIPVPIFDPAAYVFADANTCSGSNCVIRVVNIMGFFLEGMCDDAGFTLDAGTDCSDKKNVVGRLVANIGQRRGGLGTAPVGNSFVTVMRLVR